MTQKIEKLQEIKFPFEAKETLTPSETLKYLAERPEHQIKYGSRNMGSEPVELNSYGEIMNDLEDYSVNSPERNSGRMEKYGQVEIYKSIPQDVNVIYELGKEEPRFLGFWPRDCLEKAVHDPNIFMYSARINKALKGFALASYTPSLEKVSFENLYVAPDARRVVYNGDTISGNLIDKVIEQSEKVGARYLMAQTEADNLAIQRRLQRDGFNFVGEQQPKTFFFGYKNLGGKNDN